MALNDLGIVQAGERTNPEGKPVTNRILLAIPDDEYALIRPYLEHLQLERHDTLHEPNATPRFVYFPNTGLLSLVVVTVDRKTVEAGIVGREGIVGLASAMGLPRNPLREIVQISGHGFKIRIETLQNMLGSTPRLQILLSRYAVLHGLQVSQTAACNRLHGAAQRLARWLLMTQDRVDAAILEITHDFLATMLGTDRPSITVAASQLQNQQLIEYGRGSVKILNRKKLENFACECYGVVQQLNGELGLK